MLIKFRAPDAASILACPLDGTERLSFDVKLTVTPGTPAGDPVTSVPPLVPLRSTFVSAEGMFPGVNIIAPLADIPASKRDPIKKFQVCLLRYKFECRRVASGHFLRLQVL
jgi:hypothetical protein